MLVLDGCRPDEIGSGLMPTVQALRDGGKNYPRASSLPIMETIPNHVMMMTGVRPDRSGVPANSIYDRALGDVRDMDRASDIRTTTVINQLNRSGRTTGTVLSKEYLYGVFGTRATHRWEPQPVIPVSGHAPDVFTVDAAISMVEEFDPHLVFVNLGDIDRLGHSDVTGTTVKAARRRGAGRHRPAGEAVRGHAEVHRQVGHLDAGRARRPLDGLVAAAPGDQPAAAARRRPAARGQGPDRPERRRRPPLLDRLRRQARRGDRPDARGSRRPTPACWRRTTGKASRPWLRLGARAGDVVVWCKAGWRFSDPSQTSNPIPGNHGHPATYPIPFFLAGGHPAVPRRATSSGHARTQDVAPTVAAFFGLAAPRGGWDGRSRL